jgi:sulfite reductase (ferredoxin)
MSVEELKANSNGLRGALPIQLLEPTPHFDDDVKNLLKFHGIYQQHDRDVRGRNNRVHSFMVRSRIPGGRLTPLQYLVHDALGDEFGKGDIRLTTRQGIQLHGVIKDELKPTLRKLNNVLVSTLAACGDVARNVMSCPAPFGDPVREELQAMAQSIASHLAPRTTAYHEIWLEDDEGKKVRQRLDGEESTPVDEPIYGKTYLPRKFKIAIAYPGDNCTDILSNDIGLVGLIDESGLHVHGYNIFVGGGLGATHNDPATYPRLASPLAYVPVEQTLDVVEKIVMVQRDHGDRTDRKHARMKYVVEEWGSARFKATVEEYLGYSLEDVRPMPELAFDDHLGWHPQQDGLWFYGIYVENGRVKDDGNVRMRSGLRSLVQQFQPQVIITAQQNIILSGFTTEQKVAVEETLRTFGVPTVEELSLVRRNAMACPALPTCGLALAEAERFLPSVIDEIELIAGDLGLANEHFSIRMTGCPNGCARPYVADIGLVGRTLGKYNIYLGGNMEGTRLNTLYKELVSSNQLGAEIRIVLERYVQERQPAESVGSWATRVGIATLQESVATPA